MNRFREFIYWYKHLTKQGHGRIICIEYALYNSKYYDKDGNYK